MFALALIVVLSLISFWVLYCQGLYTPWEQNMMSAILMALFLLYLFWYFLQVDLSEMMPTNGVPAIIDP